MNTPFVYGRIAVGSNFIDREGETAQLVSNFTSLINTIIISPRRWGKSSLVNKAAGKAAMRDERLRVCAIDLFNVRNEEHFFELLAKSVLMATSSRWEEAVDSAKKFFKMLVPRIILGSGDMQNDISLSFNWEELKQNPDEILDLAEEIAKSKDLKIIICIDEFQNIAEFANHGYLQKKLRAHWQQHQHVAYCLYGSKRHMMLDVFTDMSMPFYKFGDLIFLDKIDTPSWLHFITQQFAGTNKNITGQEAELIVGLADNHPYYVQQLSQQVWLRTETTCSEEIVRRAHISLVEQLSLLFAAITESLTSNQLNLLFAILNEEAALSSAATLKKYNLGTSAGIVRAKKSLIQRDILDDEGGKITFQDPMYRYWLKIYYFKTNQK